ncbi:MAG TPA: hypothetical protein VFS69_01735 [Sphingomicrobium sp.]|nr:hypothetical protein [Sphingomicrobium sp.]
MDSFRDFPGDFEPSAGAGEHNGTVSEIGTDERRMHVRAYNYWVSLLDGRDYPSIEDLEPNDLVDFAPNSVLLDFTAGRDDPATPYIGDAIRAECDLPGEVQSIAQVPSRSLLSRLTDHYMQIIANRAPVGFEAEFENQRDEAISYRGIMMPFSSDGDTIDFIYGVINWKKAGDEAAPRPAAVDPAPVLEEPAEEEPLTLTEIVGVEPLDLTDVVEVPMVSEPAEEDETGSFEIAIDIDENAGLGEDAGLADRLWAARESAEAVKSAEGRSRDALYQALARAYDFALAAKAEPDDYAELLEDSGVKAQVRAPMTPVVKLIFGIDYDKARLTEYAAALSYADRQEVELGGFLAFIEAQAGGLKALVAAERQARRPQPKTDTKTEKARERLRTARTVALDSISSEEEFALVLTRRSSGGQLEAIALVEDPALVERAIRRVGA